ncbi:MAG: hypothetical protein KDC45_02860 [Bacteroidetes bacterium]|nr:hypothetical protein [Bacteroidota bacterium]
MESTDLWKTTVLIAGLFGFAALLYVSQRQKKRLEERKKRLRNHLKQDETDES